MRQPPLAAPSPATSIYAAILDMDGDDLARFRQRLRRRYSREEIVEELRACAARLEASPTMRQFAEDPEATIHPQTVVDHFGSWNAAKREAGLMPRRRATREELLDALRGLADELGRRPSTKDVELARGRVPSRGVYAKAFGSMRAALEAAGLAEPTREELLARSIDHGAAFMLRTGRLPSFRDWDRIRGDRDDVMTSWQLYRTFERLGGAWSAFQYAVDERVRGLKSGTGTPEEAPVPAVA